jgi:hypothetical protein
MQLVDFLVNIIGDIWKNIDWSSELDVKGHINQKNTVALESPGIKWVCLPWQQ